MEQGRQRQDTALRTCCEDRAYQPYSNSSVSVSPPNYEPIHVQALPMQGPLNMAALGKSSQWAGRAPCFPWPSF